MIIFVDHGYAITRAYQELKVKIICIHIVIFEVSVE